MTTEQPNSSTQQLLNALLQSATQQNHKLDVLTDQIGHLTEVVTTGFAELKDGFSELKDGFSELKGGFSELKAITQEQAETARQQAETVRLLAESVSSLVGVLTSKEK